MLLYKVTGNKFERTEFEDLTPGLYVIKDNDDGGCWVGARVFRLIEQRDDWWDLWKDHADNPE